MVIDINYVMCWVWVCWDEFKVRFFDIFGVIVVIGYCVYLYDVVKNEEIFCKEWCEVLWCLWVVGFGMM